GADPDTHGFTLVFFFFQAEDGIRDFHVTGVQTCALPICGSHGRERRRLIVRKSPLSRCSPPTASCAPYPPPNRRAQWLGPFPEQDRKSTRLNSSHVKISYAVFCLKKKKLKNTL